MAPETRSPDYQRKPSKIPIEEKKTFVWIEHHRDLVDLAATMPQTQLVNVGDREADFFELFDEQRHSPCVDLLIRAQHDRTLSEAPFKLFAAIRQTSVQSRVGVSVPKQSARPKKSKQKAKPARPGRQAELALRHLTIQLPAPSYYRDKEPVEIQLIHAVEENPPQGTKAVEWFLLTTLNIDSAKDLENVCAGIPFAGELRIGIGCLNQVVKLMTLLMKRRNVCVEPLVLTWLSLGGLCL